MFLRTLFICVVTLLAASSLKYAVLAAPQQQQNNQPDAQNIAAHHHSRVVLNCVVPSGHVFEGWQFNGQPVQYTNIISRGREVKNSEHTEKLVIERFQYPTHAGQWACLQRTEQRPYRQTRGLINLNLLQDGLENIDAATTSSAAMPFMLVCSSLVALLAAKIMA